MTTRQVSDNHNRKIP